MADWTVQAQNRIKRMSQEEKEVRQLALDNLYFFARLVNPSYVYGDIHKEVFEWMEEYCLFGKNFFKNMKGKVDSDLPESKLVMLPRAHLKSHCVATWCAWMIARHPEVTILYLSATASLAEKQLYAIKNILTSPQFRKYFPEYICPNEHGRDLWNNNAINIDHPLRRELGIRDNTIATAGLTTNTTGWHADIIAADDLVVPENAYTEEGRDSVSRKVAQFSSIRNAGGFSMAGGTRYHPKDEYSNWKTLKYEVYDEEGLLTGSKRVWDIKEYPVEEDGIFLWPRTSGADGKMYGFNANVLSKTKAEYSRDPVQFYSQYYNNPNSEGLNGITREHFQYYDQKFLKLQGDSWYFKDNKLNVYAAVDFAYSMGKRSDYTAIVVIGIDCDGNVYVLDIERFRADKIKDYYDKLATLHSQWEFKKLRAEVSVAQKVIVNDLKEHIRKNGRRISVDEYRPTRKDGSKEERIAAALEPRYSDLRMWHRRDGYTPALEEELIMLNPPHDDIKDALSAAVSIAVKPQRRHVYNTAPANKLFNSRFGGVSYGG